MKALLSRQKIINQVVLVPANQISPNPSQPRKFFDEEKIDQLAVSISQYGLLQPITVKQTAEGDFQLVAGERRLLACKKLKMETVPVIIAQMNDEQSSVLALIENIQRCDLNFFEEASAIKNLMKKLGETQQAIAQRLGKNQSTVANKLRLLQYCPQVRQALLSANLTERHARALLPLAEKGDDALLDAIHVITEKQLNVAQTELYIEQLTEDKEQAKTRPTRLFVVKDLRIFLNSIEKAISTMKLSGIQAATQVEESDDCFLYTVRIPKESAYRRKEKPPAV